MTSIQPIKRRRGRPPKDASGHNEIRQQLVRAGVELLTEAGYSSTGLDAILKRVQIPKGSFYHYFKSKEAFGEALIANYNSFFKAKISKHLKATQEPLHGFFAFVDDAVAGLEKYHFRRGCLVGNLGQELNTLPVHYRQLLIEVFGEWQSLVADYLATEQKLGHISANRDCQREAALFWTGWEGAILHAKLQQSAEPMRQFSDYFAATLQT
ncbi:TetR family transcriptional regulator [Pseudidiomarina aquimaris]|uniref:TetR family transcriptional regulator n=1 Tax=Pseudidiomarina aquimaris TaxID=641841 RepID=A0A432XBN8_9GAMM|nr:TetR/AcrR family transcriptional regulator [Pseudidiomarina aquimaris]RUO46169.1 TetR family transcriptional regulator [Pseudidiomarina aquimaris]